MIGTDSAHFEVEHQQETWTCWAAVIRAIAGFHGIDVPSQKGIAPNKGPGKPVKWLVDNKSFVKGPVWKPGRANSKVEAERAENGMIQFITQHLRNGPLVARLGERHEKTWLIVKPLDDDAAPQAKQLDDNASPQAKPLDDNAAPQAKQLADYAFSHAVIVFGIDNLGRVLIADPALHFDRNRAIATHSLIHGFDYASSAMFGAGANALFVGRPPSNVRARLVELQTVLPLRS